MIFVSKKSGKEGELIFEFDIMGNGGTECLYFGRMYEGKDVFDCFVSMDFSNACSIRYDVFVTDLYKCISYPPEGIERDDGFVFEIDDYLICDKKYAIEHGYIIDDKKVIS